MEKKKNQLAFTPEETVFRNRAILLDSVILMIIPFGDLY